MKIEIIEEKLKTNFNFSRRVQAKSSSMQAACCIVSLPAVINHLGKMPMRFLTSHVTINRRGHLQDACK